MSQSDNYEVSDSEDDYSEDEKLLLEKARKTLSKQKQPVEDAVYRLDSDNDDNDSDEFHGGEDVFGDEDVDGEDDIDMGSDIENIDDQPPDERAWGKKKKIFHGTNNVDQDYRGAHHEDAEAAQLEEEEARIIQQRLLEQLNDADFSFGDLIPGVEETDATTKETLIKSDLSQLTKRQKLDLLKKESPEFIVLVEDFKSKLLEARDRLMPVLNLVHEKTLPSCLAADFLETKLYIILNYCTNIGFYLLQKSKRLPVKDHPVLKSLFHYRQLLQQLQPCDDFMKPQLDKILGMLKSGEEIKVDTNERDTKKNTGKKVELGLMDKEEKNRKTKGLKFIDQEGSKMLHMEQVQKDIDSDDYDNNDDDNDDLVSLSKDMDKDEDDTDEEMEGYNGKGEQEVVAPKIEKRAITYTIAKNKGLIPRRSKEQRNPRVKHRKKFKKAIIRRRGQVRMPRKEIPVYGGEMTGIKIGLTKSVKFK